MKKNIILISIVILNITALVLLITNYKSTEYPEKIFTKKITSFDAAMQSFMKQVDSNIEDIKIHFTEGEVSKQNLKNYYIGFMNKYELFQSSIFLKNNQKFVIRRDKDSYVAGYDNTEKVDLVKWERIRKEKVISSWDESFVLNIRDLEWFKKLSTTPNSIRWFFDTATKENKSQEDLFYCGYFFTKENDSYYLIFRFSRMALVKEFPSFSNFDNLNTSTKLGTGLLVETSNGGLYNLSTGINEFFQAVPSDSLHNQVDNHIQKFNDKTNGIFTFKYHDLQIWSFFRKFDARMGLKFFMLTIPEPQLIKTIKNHNHIYIVGFLSLFILSFLGIYLLLRKRRTVLFSQKTESLTEIVAQDENRFLEFKSSLRWDYRQEKPNPILEDVILKTVAAFGNSDGGILLIGVDDNKNILGLQNDYNTLKKKDSDYFEIHLRKSIFLFPW